MSYKNILAVLDDAPSMGSRIDAALFLAQLFDAHLTGLAVTRPAEVPDYIIPEMASAIRSARQEALAALTRDISAAFESRAIAARPRECWSLVMSPDDSLAQAIAESRVADLVVTGQIDRDRPGRAVPVPPVDLVMGAGCPVLVVPFAGKVTTLGERVIVAWNGSRESARAVHDAMPLLRRAKSVQVLCINPARSREPAIEPPEKALVDALSRHGVTAEIVIEITEELDPADLLLNQAADTAADLVVMGAYGRSRVRELVLGGMTRSIVQHMTVPVLMSH